jgi:hypothetical protein
MTNGETVEDQDPEVEPGVVFGLLRISHKEYLEEFADGTLYCNSLDYFRAPAHAHQHWYDRTEGTIAVYQPDRIGQITLAVAGKTTLVIEPTEHAAPVTVSMKEDCRLFCMYAIHPGKWNREFTERELREYVHYMAIKPRMNGFGLHVAVVMNGAEFIKRARLACDSQGILNSGGLVEYANLATFHGAFPAHRHGRIKDAQFKAEREYRFVFKVGDAQTPFPQPYRLKVGSLRDIVTIAPWNQFRKTATLSFPGDDRKFFLVKPKRLPRKVKKALWKPR